MGLGGEENENKSSPQFEITSYSDGYFAPNGDKVEFPYDQDQLNDWNYMNKLFGNKCIGSGQKLILPNEATSGYRIICGRNQNTCDVVIDSDIIGRFTQGEQAVSRTHFDIQKRTDGKWEISDLGSTNGVSCQREGSDSKLTELKETTEPWVLKDGDMFFVGGGPTTSSRFIGFRFYEPPHNESFLVKFNATSLDDLLLASGEYDRNPSLIGKISTESATDKVNKAVEESGNALVSLNLDIQGLKDGDNKLEFTEKALSFQFKILETVKELGNHFYEGDWTVAAADIGSSAFEKGDKIIKDKGDEITKEEANKVRSYLDISSQLMDFASKYSYIK